MAKNDAPTTATTTLYEAAEDMLRVSMLVYTLAFLRGQARQPDTWVRNASELLDLPLSLDTCRKAIEANMNEMMERRNNSASSGNSSQEDDNPHYQEAIGLLHEGISKMGGGEVDETTFDDKEDPCLVAFGDEREQTELVYAIGVNPHKKRIVVAFRGSVTKTDWKTDASVKVEKRKNPLLDCFKDTNEDPQQQQPATIGYHAGFYRYLFEPPNQEGGETKAEEILRKVLEIYDAEEKRDYDLYVTGHSLGGALSTLFAFFVASKVARLETTIIPTPIICVSLASPRPGDVGFQSAFESLERTSFLRHLRVVNEKDPVTRIPVNIRTFRHTGVKLKLRQRGMMRRTTREDGEETETNALDDDDDDLPPFEIRYSSCPNDASEGSGGSRSIMNSISANSSESARDNSGTKIPRRRRRLVRKMIPEQHSCVAYYTNLLESKDCLHQSGVTLDGLYDALVGSIKTRVENRRSRRLLRRQKVLQKFPLLNRAFGSSSIINAEDNDSSDDSDNNSGIDDSCGSSSNSFLWSSGSTGSDKA